MPCQIYLFNRKNDTKCRLNGIEPSTRMPNKEQLCELFANHKVLSIDELPPKVDLRPDMTPVENQSRIGSW